MTQSLFGKAFLACLLMIGSVATISYARIAGTPSQRPFNGKHAGGKTKEFPGSGATPLVVEPDGANYRVTHSMGTVFVPAHPRRICSLGFTDELLAIGVKPVAASCTNGKFPDYLVDWLDGVIGINHLMGIAQPNFETLVNVRPDLIISSTGDPQTYRQLSKIAPVVVLESDSDCNRQRLLDLGELLGHRKIAERQIATFEDCVNRARILLHERIGERKVAFFRIHGKQFYIHGHTRGGIMLYDELGFTPPSLIEGSRRGFVLSPEALLQLDAEYIFVAAEHNPGAQRSWKSVGSHPAWMRVPAVRNGQVYSLSDQHQWLIPGFLAKSRMLKEILQALAPDCHDLRVPQPYGRGEL